MPRLPEAKKDAASCDKLREGAYGRKTRRFPNGATHPARDTYLVGANQPN